jgi:hypothetical protein
LEDFTGGPTNWLQGIVYWAHKSSWIPDTAPGNNNAGYYFGGIPPKGSDANFNRYEDFAESFAALIYPEKALSGVNDKISADPSLRSLFYYDNYLTTPRGLWMSSFVYLSVH